MKKLLFLFINIILLSSCFDKRIKEPETSDLIYIDIQKDIDKVNRVIKLRQTEVEVVKGEMDSLHIRSPEIQVKKNRIYVMQKDIKRFKQLKKYFEIKLKKRKSYSRILYETKFKDGKEWPDQSEYAEYVIAKEKGFLPIKEINKADSSRELTHKKDVGEILRKNGL